MKEFNLIIAGFGGQGVITLADLISKIALSENFETKQAELHGLAQRGGSVQTHVRFGAKVFSPKVERAGADLIITLDLLEAEKACFWASKEKTIVLSESEIFWPQENLGISPKEIAKEIGQFAKQLELVEAGKITQEVTGNQMAANIYLLGYTISHQFLPFKKEKVWQIISENLNIEFLEANKKVFEKAFEK